VLFKNERQGKETFGDFCARRGVADLLSVVEPAAAD
jgi:hypothetical protein